MGKTTSRTFPEEFLKERTLVPHPTEPALRMWTQLLLSPSTLR